MAKIARAPGLAAEVATKLETRVRAGELAPGERLPTEKTLAESFGVSRAVVREAIARLKAGGLVATRQGAGAFVVERPLAKSFRFAGADAAVPEGMRHVFELRAMIEGATAELAARRRTGADLAALRGHVAGMDAALAGGLDGSEIDDAFHAAIAAATRNPLVQRFVEFLGAQFSDSRRLTWRANLRERVRPQESQREHHVLLAAIEAGDPAAARKAATDHLQGAAHRLLGIDLAAGPESVEHNN